MRALAFVVFVVGCSDVPGPDIDGDGVTDDDDPCQAGFADDIVDADNDGKDATVDLCPHDTNAVAGDQDFDGIPDACDPFFDAINPDTRRCVTAFRVRWMNASYLEARVGEQGWDLASPLQATASETVSTVSTLELDFPSTSFDVVGTAAFKNADDSSSFKLWLRAGDTPSDKDVACGLDGSGNLFVFAGNTRQNTVTLPAPITGAFRLRATVGGLNSTVLCRATVGAVSISTTGQVALQPGRFGFASTQTEITIDSLVIDSNATAVRFSNHFDDASR